MYDTTPRKTTNNISDSVTTQSSSKGLGSTKRPLLLRALAVPIRSQGARYCSFRLKKFRLRPLSDTHLRACLCNSTKTLTWKLCYYEEFGGERTNPVKKNAVSYMQESHLDDTIHACMHTM
eukprot:6486434-Amphidinium_carterae.2